MKNFIDCSLGGFNLFKFFPKGLIGCGVGYTERLISCDDTFFKLCPYLLYPTLLYGNEEKVSTILEPNVEFFPCNKKLLLVLPRFTCWFWGTIWVVCCLYSTGTEFIGILGLLFWYKLELLGILGLSLFVLLTIELLLGTSWLTIELFVYLLIALVGWFL